MKWDDKCVQQIDVATLKGFECVFQNVVSILFAFAGIVLFVMLLAGGFKFLASNGDPKQVESAKGALTHAIVGLVLLVLAYVIIELIASITGAKITDFKIVQ